MSECMVGRRWPLGLAVGCIGALAATTVGAQTLRGTVLDQNGGPAEGAVVWMAGMFAPGPLVVHETRSDGRGRFELSFKAAGELRWCVWARKGNAGAQLDYPQMPVVVAGRDPAPVTLRLHPWGILRGRLIEAETGRPIAGGRLVIDNACVLTTSGDGRFELAGLRPREHEAYVVAPGRLRQRVLFDTTLRPRAELELRIPAGGKMVGRVTGTDGKLIPGAYVGFHTSGTAFSGNALWEWCDDQGRFVWDGKPLDRPTRLEADAPGFAALERDNLIISADGSPLEVNFTLEPDPRQAGARAAAHDDVLRRDLAGTVLGPGGKPVAGALVRWGMDRYVGVPDTRTGADGRFVIARLPDQENYLTVVATGLAPAFVHLARGEGPAPRVALETGETVSGVVRDQRGNPLEGVTVTPMIPSPNPRVCNPLWLPELAATTDARGRFTVTGVPKTGAKFDFLREGLSALRNEDLEIGGGENVVRMEGAGAIRGRVVDAAGKPVRSFRILVNIPRQITPTEKAGGFFAGYCGIGLSYTGDDGVFVVTGVTAGFLHRISALAEGHGQADADRVEARPLTDLPSADELTLKLGPAHVLGVHAVGADGAPMAKARVTLVNGELALDRSFMWGYHDASWEDMVRARTDTSGWVRFPCLTCGEATVLVQAPGRARQRVGWRKGEPELTVTLGPEASLAVEVVDETGRPATDVGVSLLSPTGDQFPVAPEPDRPGHYRVDQMSDGDYTLNVFRRTGAGSPPEKLHLDPGQSLRRTVRLHRDEAPKGLVTPG